MITREQILAKYPNATEADIEATLKSYNQEKPSKVTGVARSALQGVTFGFGDEAIARVRSLFGRPYDQLVKEERELLDKFREAYPELAYPAEIAGAFVVPGIGLGKGLYTGAKLAVTGKGIASAVREGRKAKQVAANAPVTLSSAIKTGAGQGAVYGAGSADGDILDRAGGAVLGGLTGTVTAPIAVGATKAASKFTRRKLPPGDRRFVTAANRVMDKTVKDIGRDEAKVLASQGKAPTEFYREALSEMGDDAMVADVLGPRAKARVEGAVIDDIDAFGIAEPRLTSRASDEFKRVTDYAKKLLDARTDATRLSNTMTKWAASRARPIYREAENGPNALIALDDVDDFFVLHGEDFKNAYQRAERIARREGNPIPSWGDFLKKNSDGVYETPAVSIGVLQRIKLGLDDLIEKGPTPESGLGKQEKNSLKTLRRQYTSRLGELNPTYAEANRIMKVGYDINDAVESGLNALKEEPEEIGRIYRKLQTDYEKRAFRSGVLQSVRKLGKKESTSLAARIVGDRDTKEQLRYIFPDEQSFDNFLKFLRQEQSFGKTKKQLLGNSATARRQGLREDAGIQAADLVDDATGFMVNPTYQAGTSAQKYLPKFANLFQNKNLSEDIAELTLNEPRAALDRLDQIQRIYSNITDSDRKALQHVYRHLIGASRFVPGAVSGGLITQ